MDFSSYVTGTGLVTREHRALVERHLRDEARKAARSAGRKVGKVSFRLARSDGNDWRLSIAVTFAPETP